MRPSQNHLIPKLVRPDPQINPTAATVGVRFLENRSMDFGFPSGRSRWIIGKSGLSRGDSRMCGSSWRVCLGYDLEIYHPNLYNDPHGHWVNPNKRWQSSLLVSVVAFKELRRLFSPFFVLTTYLLNVWAPRRPHPEPISGPKTSGNFTRDKILQLIGILSTVCACRRCCSSFS